MVSSNASEVRTASLRRMDLNLLHRERRRVRVRREGPVRKDVSVWSLQRFRRRTRGVPQAIPRIIRASSSSVRGFSDDPVRRPGAYFVVSHAHPAKRAEDAGQRAGQGDGYLDFSESGTGILGKMGENGLLLFGRDALLAPGVMMEVFDASRALALAEQLLDKAERYREAAGNPELSGIAFVDGIHDAFAQIQGYCLHMPRKIVCPGREVYSIL